MIASWRKQNPSARSKEPGDGRVKLAVSSVWTGDAMLVRTSPDVADCLQRAAECELQAERATEPIAKQSFLDLAARWRRIAETFEYVERVDRFLKKPHQA